MYQNNWYIIVYQSFKFKKKKKRTNLSQKNTNIEYLEMKRSRGQILKATLFIIQFE